MEFSTIIRVTLYKNDKGVLLIWLRPLISWFWVNQRGDYLEWAWSKSKNLLNGLFFFPLKEKTQRLNKTLLLANHEKVRSYVVREFWERAMWQVLQSSFQELSMITGQLLEASKIMGPPFINHKETDPANRREHKSEFFPNQESKREHSQPTPGLEPEGLLAEDSSQILVNGHYEIISMCVCVTCLWACALIRGNREKEEKWESTPMCFSVNPI